MKNDFARAVFGTTKAEKIVAVFKSGHEAEYTMEIFNLLTTDPDVETIYSAETGEVYYAA